MRLGAAGCGWVRPGAAGCGHAAGIIKVSRDVSGPVSAERYRSGRNGGASKASCPARGTGVRIPPSPPNPSHVRSLASMEASRHAATRSIVSSGRESLPPPQSLTASGGQRVLCVGHRYARTAGIIRSPRSAKTTRSPSGLRSRKAVLPRVRLRDGALAVVMAAAAGVVLVRDRQRAALFQGRD